MSSGFSGAQPKMRPTELEEGCVGPFPNTIDAFYREKWSDGMADVATLIEKYVGKNLPSETPMRVGQTQSMVFAEDDAGPFYLSVEQSAKQKYDRKTGDMVTQKKNIAELRNDLQKLGIEAKGRGVHPFEKK